jgi:hypothetical protein
MYITHAFSACADLELLVVAVGKQPEDHHIKVGAIHAQPAEEESRVCIAVRLTAGAGARV